MRAAADEHACRGPDAEARRVQEEEERRLLGEAAAKLQAQHDADPEWQRAQAYRRQLDKSVAASLRDGLLGFLDQADELQCELMPM